MPAQSSPSRSQVTVTFISHSNSTNNNHQIERVKSVFNFIDNFFARKTAEEIPAVEEIP